jgi:hypothetical protein
MKYGVFVHSLVLTTLIFISGSTHSSEKIEYGDWSFLKGKTYKNIHTINHHKLEFGYLCKKECMFYIKPALVCHKNRVVDGWMIESSGVTKRVFTRCIQHDGVDILRFNSDKDIFRILLSNDVIHFLFNFDIKTNSLMSFDTLGFKDSFDRLNE